MKDMKNQYGKNFRDAVASIQKLPPTERSAMSNRPGPLPKLAPPPPKRSA